MFSRKSFWLTIKIYALILTGVVLIATSSNIWAQFKYDDAAYFVKRQLLFALLGTIVMKWTSSISIQTIKKNHRMLLICCFIALLLVLVPGIGVTRNGSRSWFGVGSFLIQPSEFFKLSCIFTTAFLIEKKTSVKRLSDVIGLLVVPALGFLLILLQPDFGSGLVMVCSIVVMILAAGAPMKYFMACGCLGVLGIVFLIAAAPYRMQRILSFLDPWSDPLGSGFQIIQSYYAIAPGGLLGAGLNRSMQKHFYLPEPQTDFIFAIACEELGWIGALCILILFILILSDCVTIALRCKDTFSSFVVVGITALFMIQVLINLGVVVGLFPVTGITLPFLSYGGSSLVMLMGSFGLIIGINQQDSDVK
ncbi:MAG: putative lipid II flippase FtsW [Erysipelotrichaceae bacterium]|nr:putative lipid II flippase FtsW [Erysipelotrichaceae bacterium]